MNGRTNAVAAAGGGSVPAGVICMWSGSSAEIPAGWVLCDGSNNTPDLRGRFVVGAGGAYDVGDTGGADSVALTTAQMPSHSHGGSVSVTSGGAHTHELYISNDIAGFLPMLTQTSFRDAAGGISVGDDNVKDAGAHTHNATLSISSAGSGNAHENRPPYYALCYIMKQ